MPRALRRLRTYFHPHWPMAIGAMAAHSGLEILDLAVPYALGQIINALSDQPLDGVAHATVQGIAAILPTGLETNDRGLAIGVLLGIIFIVSVVRAPIQPWLTSWFHWIVAIRARHDRQADAIAKILTLPLSFYDTHNPGRIASRISRGLENYTWTYPEVAGQLVPKLARVVGIFGVMLAIEWRVAVPFFLSFGGVLWFALSGLQRIVMREQLVDSHIETTSSHTSELVTNIKTVKAFATEQREYSRQRSRLDRELFGITYGVHRDYVILDTWQRTAIQTASFLVFALILWAAVAGKISLGYFVTLMTIANMGYAELEPISFMADLLARRYAAIERFHEFMEETPGLEGDYDRFTQTVQLATPAHPTGDRRTDDHSPTPQRGRIEFRDVTFGYDQDTPVLSHINLTIEPNETVALVGRSGSGKSTLTKLLFRYFEPNTGDITLDGKNIRELDPSLYRRRLAIVHQDVDVFNGTLLDNLRYGNPNAPFAAVERAAAIARVDEFITTLPRGYKTVVGERGVRLSGGQRQRLGIARALLVDPEVLILDEATSSLDSESERAIQRAMEAVWGTRTTIAIAHRLSTIREADRIIVLDRGKIVQVGNHHELLAEGGIYQRLHALQASGDVY